MNIKNNYNYYTGNIKPANDTIFVFGSNPEGKHGAGSAKVALQKFGAVFGKGEGLHGHSYALPTTDLRNRRKPNINIETITESVRKLYTCARQHPNLKFKIAYRNQPHEFTLCGYPGKVLMDIFLNKAGEVPTNIYFSEEWWNNIPQITTTVNET